MKKILPIFVLLVLLAPTALAATLYSDNINTFTENQTKGLWPITITAQAAGEITADKGIDLFFKPEDQMLWDAVPTFTASGTAVTSGKIGATIVPTYKNVYKVLHIPVLADFASGESVTISGLRLRAYRHPFSRDFLKMDLNGDGVEDAVDISKIEVVDTLSTDFTPPYPPSDFTAVLSADLKSVTLNWKQSPDYDQLGTNLTRMRVRSGNVQDVSLLDNNSVMTYTDTDILSGDKVTYTITAGDGRNLSEPVTQTVEVKAVQPQPEVPPTPPASPAPTLPPAQTDAQAAEIKQLNSLYGYYKVRQSIKCRIGISPTDSNCLWAKIDLIYAQKLLGRSDVKIELTARDLYLIALRIVWPEKRYQTECVQAPVADSSCPTLEKSIKRAHYFIDGK